MSALAVEDWLPMDKGWVRTELSPPVDSREAGDLARCAHSCAHRLAMSSHMLDRVGSAAAYRVAGDYYEVARSLVSGVGA